jgi:hypothetical protein
MGVMKRIIFSGILILSGIINSSAQTKAGSKSFTESFMQESCLFATTGRNTYFILETGYQQTLQGIEGKDTTTLIITVLNETRMIGDVETRIIEEKEMINGKPVEISRNFFAFCKQTSTVYYFGEEVDMYKNGKIASHEGAWSAEGKNKPGVQMPGLILLGSRYYQEIAPSVAMDRAEILSMTETMKTPAGNFMDVLKTEETTPLEPKGKEYKYYAPGVGLIKDENLLLMKYGYIK